MAKKYANYSIPTTISLPTGAWVQIVKSNPQRRLLNIQGIGNFGTIMVRCRSNTGAPQQTDVTGIEINKDELLELPLLVYAESLQWEWYAMSPTGIATIFVMEIISEQTSNANNSR